MGESTLIVAILVGALPAQDAKPPVKQAKPAKPKLPPFAKAEAKWVIKGQGAGGSVAAGGRAVACGLHRNGAALAESRETAARLGSGSG